VEGKREREGVGTGMGIDGRCKKVKEKKTRMITDV
jgi:hypothetical protein